MAGHWICKPFDNQWFVFLDIEAYLEAVRRGPPAKGHELPTRPGRTCLTPRCPNVVTDPNASRCRVHERVYQQTFDSGRPGPRQRGYTSKWEKRRRKFLENFPTCAMCGAPATDVDHIIAKADGGSDDAGNLRSLCHSCHSTRTGEEQGHFAKRCAVCGGTDPGNHVRCATSGYEGLDYRF